jgi:hypothetical protein
MILNKTLFQSIKSLIQEKQQSIVRNINTTLIPQKRISQSLIGKSDFPFLLTGYVANTVKKQKGRRLTFDIFSVYLSTKEKNYEKPIWNQVSFC